MKNPPARKAEGAALSRHGRLLLPGVNQQRQGTQEKTAAGEEPESIGDENEIKMAKLELRSKLRFQAELGNEIKEKKENI